MSSEQRTEFSELTHRQQLLKANYDNAKDLLSQMPPDCPDRARVTAQANDYTREMEGISARLGNIVSSVQAAVAKRDALCRSQEAQQLLSELGQQPKEKRKAFLEGLDPARRQVYQALLDNHHQVRSPHWL